MNLRTDLLVLTSCVVFAAAGSASAAESPKVDFGFKGLKRIELVFASDAAAGEAGSVAKDATPPAAPAAPTAPADDGVSHEIPKDPDCQAMRTTLTNAGLEIVEQCKPDDLACGQLYLTVERIKSTRSTDRIHYVAVELSQRVKLSRNEKVELTAPLTWSAHRIAIVPADGSATTATCAELRTLATWFGTSWRFANR